MLDVIRDMHVYRVTRKIADGGMGSVYEATQDGVDGFQKVVAIKVLLPELSNNKRFIDMFVKEAKMVADLVHENIVQIYQLGRDASGYYIVMEYVQGLSLHEFIRFHANILRTPPPLELSVFIASRVARGLAYAHSRLGRNGNPLNIVHRDVCPNNIMITTEGLPKLADFGIAILSSDMMPEGQLMGKLSYMSPQQALRQPLDFRADIFSLGACLFEMITMRKMRFNKSEEEIVVSAESGGVDWEFLPDDLPDDVKEILHLCLAFDPDERVESSAELAKRLEYVIYKDGYGPTIQSLESYLRNHMPYLYNVRRAQVGGSLGGSSAHSPITAIKRHDDGDETHA